jgi:tetratricopeptide (TPR) repeat protein
MRHLLGCLLLAATGTMVCSGCGMRQRHAPESYETIAANERYDTDTARKEHEKATKLLDKSLYGKSAKLAEAEMHLQKALVADITYGPAHNSLGVVYMLRRNFYTAAWEFEYAAKLMPDNFEPLYNLGQLYESADKLENAVLYYEQALALAPRDPTVMGNLASAKLKSGCKLDEVRPLLELQVFHDHRAEWIHWAQDQLGRKPIQTASDEAPPRSLEQDSPESVPRLIPDERSPANQELAPPASESPETPAPSALPLPAPLTQAAGRAELPE